MPPRRAAVAPSAPPMNDQEDRTGKFRRNVPIRTTPRLRRPSRWSMIVHADPRRSRDHTGRIAGAKRHAVHAAPERADRGGPRPRVLLVRPPRRGGVCGAVVPARGARGLPRVRRGGARSRARTCRAGRGGGGARAGADRPIALRDAQPRRQAAREAADGRGRPRALQPAARPRRGSGDLDRRQVAWSRLLARGCARKRAPPALARGISVHGPAAAKLRRLAGGAHDGRFRRDTRGAGLVATVG